MIPLFTVQGPELPRTTILFAPTRLWDEHSVSAFLVCLLVCLFVFLSHSLPVYPHTLALYTYIIFDLYKTQRVCFVCIFFGWSSLKWHTYWPTCTFVVYFWHWNTEWPQRGHYKTSSCCCCCCVLVCIFVSSFVRSSFVWFSIIKDNKSWHLCI